MRRFSFILIAIFSMAYPLSAEIPTCAELRTWLLDESSFEDASWHTRFNFYQTYCN